MTSLDKALPIVAGKSLADPHDAHVIYTHGNRPRLFIMLIFGSYLVLFIMFSRFLRTKIEDMEQLQPIFLNNPELTKLIYYLVGGGGWLLGVGLLAYFGWWLVDIWGLQVWVSNREIRVQNTILGPTLAKYSGVGRLEMTEIREIKASNLYTILRGNGATVRFSPVENLDRLMQWILARAHHAKISD